MYTLEPKYSVYRFTATVQVPGTGDFSVSLSSWKNGHKANARISGPDMDLLLEQYQVEDNRPDCLCEKPVYMHNDGKWIEFIPGCAINQAITKSTSLEARTCLITSIIKIPKRFFRPYFVFVDDIDTGKKASIRVSRSAKHNIECNMYARCSKDIVIGLFKEDSLKDILCQEETFKIFDKYKKQNPSFSFIRPESYFLSSSSEGIIINKRFDAR